MPSFLQNLTAIGWLSGSAGPQSLMVRAAQVSCRGLTVTQRHAHSSPSRTLDHSILAFFCCGVSWSLTAFTVRAPASRTSLPAVWRLIFFLIGEFSWNKTTRTGAQNCSRPFCTISLSSSSVVFLFMPRLFIKIGENDSSEYVFLRCLKPNDQNG